MIEQKFFIFKGARGFERDSNDRTVSKKKRAACREGGALQTTLVYFGLTNSTGDAHLRVVLGQSASYLQATSIPLHEPLHPIKKRRL